MNVIWSVSVVLLTCGRVVSQSTNCTVNGFKVQENFDPDKFEGQWFAHMLLTETDLEDITHTYQKDGRGNLDVYLRERISAAKECTYDRHKLEQPNAGTAMNAKMIQDLPGGKWPFWVMSTDYTSYAVVYGCRSIMNPTGTCGSGDVHSVVWVREVRRALPDITWSIINTTLTTVCTDPRSYRQITHSEQGCRQCKPSQWTVQANFDIGQHMGLWFEVMWIPPKEYPPEWAVTDFYQTYSKGDNKVVAKRGARSVASSECSIYPDAYLNFTTVPGKLKYIQESGEVYDYWVIETRPDEYAFVLGCINVTESTGECVKYTGFVWSRTPGIGGRVALRLKRLMDQYCVDDRLYAPTDHVRDCSSKGFREEAPVFWLVTLVIHVYVWRFVRESL